MAAVIPVPQRLHAHIGELQEMLKEVDPRHVYHVPDYFHMTLKLIGWLNNERKRNFPAILEILESEIKSFTAFRIELRGLAYFPSAIYVKADDPDMLIRSMNKRLLERLGKLVTNSPYEGDSFMPHVTIATFKARNVENLLQKIRELADAPIGSMLVSEVRTVEFRAYLAYGRAEEQANALKSVKSIMLEKERRLQEKKKQ